ncbi:MAG: HD domain-containing protein [Mogibacterium sp.]|nr:HD domain-containing protein [Mogibacterium sp.]
MKKYYTTNLKDGETFDDFFMIKSLYIKAGTTGKQYLDMILSDATGEVVAKKWDLDEAEIATYEKTVPGCIVKVRAQVTDWRGQRQLRVTKMRFAQAGDGVDNNDFFKAAPEDPQEMYDFIVGKIQGFTDPDLRNLCMALYEENKDKLMYYPAAMSNHHAEYAGLLYHVKRMMMLGERACEVYTNLSRDLLLAGVAIHDIEKLTEILSDEHGVSPGYSFEGQMLGHLVQGVKVVHDKCRELGIGYEKEILLEHMVISHHYEPDFGSPKKPLFPEAEVLHYLDMIDAKMFDMEDSLAGVEPGGFGDKVWTLDNRKLYKKTF